MLDENKNTKSAQSTETKNKILKAALDLFNEIGTSEVTTHDIANKAGISPGNLYYHFNNKQTIIRNIFYQIEIFSISQWWDKSPSNREVRFTDFMRFYFGALSKYRFFFREFSSLLSHDAILAKEWKRTYESLFSVMHEVLKGWVKEGVIKPFANSKDAETFIETIWILAAFAQVHLEARIGGTSTPLTKSKTRNSQQFVKEVNRLLIRFLYPYHTEKGQRVLDLYMAI